MSIKFLVLGGGGGILGFLGGGGSADFIFMGARIFSELKHGRQFGEISVVSLTQERKHEQSFKLSENPGQQFENFGELYCASRNYYIPNSNIFNSVSVSASVTVIHSESNQSRYL